jgi:hypothetical protein
MAMIMITIPAAGVDWQQCPAPDRNSETSSKSQAPNFKQGPNLKKQIPNIRAVPKRIADCGLDKSGDTIRNSDQNPGTPYAIRVAQSSKSGDTIRNSGRAILGARAHGTVTYYSALGMVPEYAEGGAVLAGCFASMFYSLGTAGGWLRLGGHPHPSSPLAFPARRDAKPVSGGRPLPQAPSPGPVGRPLPQGRGVLRIAGRGRSEAFGVRRQPRRGAVAALDRIPSPAPLGPARLGSRPGRIQSKAVSAPR